MTAEEERIEAAKTRLRAHYTAAVDFREMLRPKFGEVTLIWTEQGGRTWGKRDEWSFA